jgi:hypothetical protein
MPTWRCHPQPEPTSLQQQTPVVTLHWRHGWQ